MAMTDFRHLLDTINKLSEDSEQIQLNDSFEIELGEDLLIETGVIDLNEEAVLIEGDDKMLELLAKHGAKLEETDWSKYDEPTISRVQKGVTKLPPRQLNVPPAMRTAGKPGYEIRRSNIMKGLSKASGENPSDETVKESFSSTEAVENAIINRIVSQHVDLLEKYGPANILSAIKDLAASLGDLEEIGSSDVSAWTKEVRNALETGSYSLEEGNVEPMQLDLFDKYDDKNTQIQFKWLQKFKELIDDPHAREIMWKELNKQYDRELDENHDIGKKVDAALHLLDKAHLTSTETDKNEFLTMVDKFAGSDLEREYDKDQTNLKYFVNIIKTPKQDDVAEIKFSKLIKKIAKRIRKANPTLDAKMILRLIQQKLKKIRPSSANIDIVKHEPKGQVTEGSADEPMSPDMDSDDKRWDDKEVCPECKKEPCECEDLDEAKYRGREVPLGKPMKGDVKKKKVYVKKPNGNVVKVEFGDPNMRIKKSNPKRRKSFRARHRCDNPGPRWKARYWSCRAW